jgi:hypothetical protein
MEIKELRRKLPEPGRKKKGTRMKITRITEETERNLEEEPRIKRKQRRRKLM